MKFLMVVVMSAWLVGCSSGYDPDFATSIDENMQVFRAGEKPPKSELDDIVDKIVSEMLSNNKFVGHQNAIAVASIVDLDDLVTTNRLGNQLSESVMHHLHNKGFRVVDFKLTGVIQVTPEGDLSHSRDYQKLKGEFQVDYLVSGTMSSFASGLNLNLRMVGLQSQVVVGSAQAYLPKSAVKQYREPSEETMDMDMAQQLINQAVDNALKTSQEQGRQVKLVDGMLTRGKGN